MAGVVLPFPAVNQLRAEPSAPLSKPSDPEQFRPWVNYDRRQGHPGAGLEPEVVWSIFRSAEHGYLTTQADLFDDMIESDGHLRSLIEGRIIAVAGKDWVIQPGGTDDASIAAAQALEESLTDELDFVELLEHQLTAPYYGYACSEIIWDVVDGLVAPVKFLDVPHRRFRTDDLGNLRLLTERHKIYGEALRPGKWFVSRRHHANLARAGLLRTATWWALFKRMSVRDLVVYAEKFGIPYITGHYDDDVTSEESREVLAQVVRDLGSDGYAVLSKSVDVVIHDSASRMAGNDGVHPALINLCEAQMSKLINGATLTSDTGQTNTGSWALGKVHQNRAFALEQADANKLSHAFVRHVAAPFIEFNNFKGARPPRLKIQVVQELEPKTRSEVASIFVNELGARIDLKQLMDEVGFRPPSRDDDASTPMIREAAREDTE